MCNKAILKNGGTLEFVHERYKSQEMYDKAVNTCLFVFVSVPDRWKTQEMCNGVVFKDTLLLISCPKIHKSLKMCDEVAQWSESIV